MLASLPTGRYDPAGDYPGPNDDLRLLLPLYHRGGVARFDLASETLASQQDEATDVYLLRALYSVGRSGDRLLCAPLASKSRARTRTLDLRPGSRRSLSRSRSRRFVGRHASVTGSSFGPRHRIRPDKT
jgi:hypothetical protein